MAEIITVKAFKKDAAPLVKIGLNVHKEILASYLILFEELTKEEQEELIKDLGKTESSGVLNLTLKKYQPIATLSYLIGLIEKSAEEQNLMQDTEVDVDEIRKKLNVS